jgi:DNA transposition AAA+ family ATPase
MTKETERMPSDTTERKWSAEEMADLRTRVEQEIRDADLTRKQAALECGIPYGTLTPWLGGTYAGDGSRIATKLDLWLGSRQRRQQIRAAIPTQSFVPTPTADAIHALLAHAQHMPDMVTITGSPGTGKTFALCEYSRRNPNVWKIVAEPALNSTRALLGALAQALGCYDQGSQHRISRDLARRMQGTGGLIAIDEAQHLTSVMLDQLRAFHDQCQVGIALVGNEGIVGRVEGGRRGTEFAQLSSRVGMRMRRPKPSRADVEALLDAWAVTDERVRHLLAAVARAPGGLRAMHKCFRLATMVAANEARPVAGEDVTLAADRLNTKLPAEAA